MSGEDTTRGDGLPSWSLDPGGSGEPVPAPPRPPASPRKPARLSGRFGPYDVLSVLGAGGMGVVYRAFDREASREVALKVLPEGFHDSQRARFAREGHLTAALQHRGIVGIHSAGEVDGTPYLAYELVEGTPFSELLRSGDREQLVQLVLDAARAVGHAHAHGVLHRDLKPDNILVDRAGRVRVADFGLATRADLERLTQTGAIAGTPQYMSPEQFDAARDQLGPHSDVWALGVILFEALTGQLPFVAANLMVLANLVDLGRFDSPRALDPSVSEALERVVVRALARAPGDRYADAGALADALEAALHEEGRGTRARAPYLAAAGALALAALVAAWAWPAPARVPRAGDDSPAEGRGQAPSAEPSPAELDALLAVGLREAAFYWRLRREGVHTSPEAPDRSTRLKRARDSLSKVAAVAPHSDAARRAREALGKLEAAKPPPELAPGVLARRARAQRLYRRHSSGPTKRVAVPKQIRWWKEVLALDPLHPGARVRLSRLEMRSSHSVDVMRRLLEALTRQPWRQGKDVVEDTRELAYAQTLVAPKLELPTSLGARLKATPGGKRDRLLRGYLCAAAVEFEARPDLLAPGLRELDGHLRERPAEVLAWLLRGFLHVRAGQLDRAERDLAIVLEAEPASSSARFYAALLAAARKRPAQEVLAQLREARRRGYPPTSLQELKRYPELAPLLVSGAFARQATRITSPN